MFFEDLREVAIVQLKSHKVFDDAQSFTCPIPSGIKNAKYFSWNIGHRVFQVYDSKRVHQIVLGSIDLNERSPKV